MPSEKPNRVLERFCRAVLVQNGGNLTDGELLEHFVTRQDEAAFETLVRRHGPMVLGACRRVLKNFQDAEDAFQSAFLVLVRKAAAIRERETVGNWLYGVAYRTALDARAKIVQRRLLDQPMIEITEPEITDARPVWRDLRSLLDQELSCLPSKYRTAIVLCDLEERTRREAARQLGIPVGTLSGRLTIARAMLAKRLTSRGLTLSASLLGLALAQVTGSACVSSRLIASTVNVAMAAAAKQIAAMASGQHTDFIKGAPHSMSLKNSIIAASVVLVVGILVGVGSPTPLVASRWGDEPRKTAAPEMKPRVLKLDSRGRRVAWSPDGKTLAVVTKNESMLNRKGSAIRLWDVEKGQVRDTLVEDLGGGLAFQQVMFSPDGKTIAATVSEEVVLANVRMIRSVIKIWDAKNLDLIRVLGGNESQLTHVVFSSDSRLVAACDPSKQFVNLWKVETGEIVHTLETKETQPWHAAFSPDNKTLVVGGQKQDKSGEVSLWNVETGKPIHTMRQDVYINAVAFSPDGKMIASNEGGPASDLTGVWNAEKGELLVSLKGSKQGSRALAFLSNKFLAVGGRDGKVRIWDIQAEKLVETLEGHSDEIHSIALSPDRKTLASVSQDEKLRLWPIGKWTGGANQGQ